MYYLIIIEIYNYIIILLYTRNPSSVYDIYEWTSWKQFINNVQIDLNIK